MSGRLREKTCVVTGGGSGIGRATCLLFAREGGKVIVADKNVAAATQTAREAGQDAIAAEVDVAKSDSVQALLRRARDQFGRIDVLGEQRWLWHCRNRR